MSKFEIWPRESPIRIPLPTGEMGRTPFASRSTYAQVVEMDKHGLTRVETMFPLGESGDIRVAPNGMPILDENFLSMKTNYDSFCHRVLK